MSKPAFIAALPREIRGLVSGQKPDAVLRGQGIYFYDLPDAFLVAAGMGRDRAALAVQAVMARETPAVLVSVGLAGSCSPQVAEGLALEATEVVDTRTGERFTTAAPLAGSLVLVTTESIATVAEKARLHGAYAAMAVDMEAATVGRLARAHGLPFRAIKGISDAHDFELASLARFAGAHGQFRTRAFAVHTALRPHRWTRTIRLGGASRRALIMLHEALRPLMRTGT